MSAISSERSLPLFSLPIEIKNREALGKLLLAARAVDRGWAVLLGKQSRVCEVMRRCPPGVHLEISIPEAKLGTRIRPLADAGHHLACLCEEGILYPDGRDYCLRKVGEGAMELLSLYFANGPRQAEDVRSHRRTDHLALVVSGNPRFDLLQPPCRSIHDADVARIRARIGAPFVLINTNFSFVNPHPSYGDPLQKLRQSGKLMTPEQERIWQGVVAAKQRLIADYRRLALALAAAGWTVVIRPHPSENLASWEAFARGRQRLHVVHEGSANAWILAAAAVIHSGCTTGVEAFLMRRPVLAYLPDYLGEDQWFSNRLSRPVASPEQVLQALAHLEDPAAAATAAEAAGAEAAGAEAERRALARHHIANSEQPFACDRILDAFAALAPAPQPLALLRSRLHACRRPLSRRLVSGLSRQLLGALPAGLGIPALQRRRAHHQLHHQKFPGLSRAELLATIERYRALGLVQAIPAVERIDTGLFLLTPAVAADASR